MPTWLQGLCWIMHIYIVQLLRFGEFCTNLRGRSQWPFASRISDLHLENRAKAWCAGNGIDMGNASEVNLARNFGSSLLGLMVDQITMNALNCNRPHVVH